MQGAPRQLLASGAYGLLIQKRFCYLQLMRYVVDACNVIFQDPLLEDTLEQRGFPAARDLLVSMLATFARHSTNTEVVAVFDGSEKGAHLPRRQTQARVVLIYADPREKADLCIIELVEDARRPGEITVVSSDKFVIRHVRKAGARQVGARSFLRQMRAAKKTAADPFRGEDPRKFGGALSARELEDWEQWLGL